MVAKEKKPSDSRYIIVLSYSGFEKSRLLFFYAIFEGLEK